MILATAGHVDHGKTALVRALTGVDTDRLPEEKRRGMSIDLGFAYATPAHGGDAEPIGFVDVPGHQAFIRNTLAGLSGVDRALLVVAADDGPMPQTIEHLALLDLLDVPLAAVVITKIDRVPPPRIVEVALAIDALLQAAGLPDAPVFPVCGIDGSGIAPLQAHLSELAATLPARPQAGNFRLAVDRAFSIAGAGLVVTGTVVSGRIAEGDVVRLLGTGHVGKVRGLHAQHRSAAECHAGQRAALNVSGPLPRPEAIARGDWLVAGDPPQPQCRIDALLRVPAAADALKHWTAVHVHCAAAHATGRIAVLEGPQFGPGKSALVQLLLDQPLGAAAGDRFIVRDASAQRTLGGGRVLDVFAPARGRAKPQRLAELRVLAIEDPAASLRGLLEAAAGGVLLEPFRRNRNLAEQEAAVLFDAVPGPRLPTSRGPLAFHPRHWEAVRTAALASLASWHARAPALTGPPPDRLLQDSAIRGFPRETVLAIAGELVREGAIVRRGMGVALPSHAPRLDAADEALWRQVQPLLAAGGPRPPSVFELSYALRADAKQLEAMLGRAAQCGLAVRVSARRYYLPAPVLALAEAAQALARQDAAGSFTASAYRDRSGVGRNLAIELLEFFDQVKYTRRVGDSHVLLATARELFAEGHG